MRIKVADLVTRYQAIYRERMRDLPIVNSRLAVEAVGFEQWEDKDLGILITPWFMNLVLFPGVGRNARTCPQVQQRNGNSLLAPISSGPLWLRGWVFISARYCSLT